MSHTETRMANDPAWPVPERPSWDEVGLLMSRTIARRTTCLRALEATDGLGIGAVLTELRSRRFLGVGYTGSLPEQPHCLDVGCLIVGSDPGCQRTIHAEMNALLFARDSGEPKVLYTTMSPCVKCLQHAIVKGVARVVFERLYRVHGPQMELCRASAVEWIHLPLGAVMP